MSEVREWRVAIKGRMSKLLTGAKAWTDYLQNSAERHTIAQEPQRAKSCLKLAALIREMADTIRAKERGRAPGEGPSPVFEEFWAEYPKKMAKGDAEKAWRAMECGPILSQIMAKLEEAKASKQWEDATYIPFPASWLRAKGWLDEYPAKPGVSHGAEEDPKGWQEWRDRHGLSEWPYMYAKEHEKQAFKQGL